MFNNFANVTIHHITIRNSSIQMIYLKGAFGSVNLKINIFQDLF